MDKWCLLGGLPGTPHTRFGIVRGGSIVSVQISVPEGTEIPMDGLRWGIEKKSSDSKVWQVPAWNARGPLTPERHNGEQARTSWRRGGKAGAA